MESPATPSTTAPKLVPAERHHQQWALVLVLLTVLLVLAYVLWGQGLLTAWLNESSISADERAVRTAYLVVGVVAVMGLTGLLIALWLAAMAWRIRQANQYPPPAYPVLRATPLLQGRAAQQQAWWHAVAAVVCVLLCAGVLAYLFHTFPMAETLRVLRP
ncbi:MAG: hypothetical protein ACKOF9_15715 [Burkholderiales bacterium]